MLATSLKLFRSLVEHFSDHWHNNLQGYFKVNRRFGIRFLIKFHYRDKKTLNKASETYHLFPTRLYWVLHSFLSWHPPRFVFFFQLDVAKFHEITAKYKNVFVRSYEIEKIMKRFKTSH